MHVQIRPVRLYHIRFSTIFALQTGIQIWCSITSLCFLHVVENFLIFHFSTDLLIVFFSCTVKKSIWFFRLKYFVSSNFSNCHLNIPLSKFYCLGATRTSKIFWFKTFNLIIKIPSQIWIGTNRPNRAILYIGKRYTLHSPLQSK